MQIDFLAYMGRPAQLGLFEKNRDERDIEAFFATLKPKEIERTRDVWRHLRCVDATDRFLRWIFAFCSVHTTYQNNMMGFLALKNWWEWVSNPDALREKIKASGMGLYNNRVRYLMDFVGKYWADPDFFTKRPNETWVACRDRIEMKILGLGAAKVSFALEMIYTEEAEVFCADTHLFQAYGLSQNKDGKHYRTIEKHWVQYSRIYNVPSAIARAILWNRKKNESDCLYWAKVFK